MSAEGRDVVPFGHDAAGRPVILVIDETQRFGQPGGGKAAELEALMRRIGPLFGESVILRVVDAKAEEMVLGPASRGRRLATRLAFGLEIAAFRIYQIARLYWPGQPANRRLQGCCSCGNRPAVVEYFGYLDGDPDVADWGCCGPCHESRDGVLARVPWRPIPHPYRPVVPAEVSR